MLRLLLYRVLGLAVILVLVSVISFSITYVVPGDVALVIAGPGASQASIEKIRSDLLLDEPFLVRYGTWLGSVMRGDLGASAITRQPVAEIVGFRLVNTMKLALAGIVLAIVLGIALGLVAALYRNSLVDYGAMLVSVLGISAPVFWVGLMLIYVFSVRLRWLPITDQGGVAHLILPAITIGMYSVAVIARVTRFNLLEVLGRDYIRTAKAKGASTARVSLKHALKNALIPVVTVAGLQFGYLMGGAVLTETVFAYPGIGRLFADVVFTRDFPVMQILMLLLAAIFAVTNFLVDISYALLDPRIRHA